MMGSQVTRDADGVLFTRAGLEIGVAATKTFVAQVAAMYLLALRLAELRGTLPPARLDASSSASSSTCRTTSRSCSRRATSRSTRDRRGTTAADFFLYLGRHVGLPVALEGALKLKEISYIATDAYAAGEMKHGPIALLDEQTPVVCVATDSPVLDKVVSNMQEVRVRGAHVIAIATEGNRERARGVDLRSRDGLDAAAAAGGRAAAVAARGSTSQPRPRASPSDRRQGSSSSALPHRRQPACAAWQAGVATQAAQRALAKTVTVE